MFVTYDREDHETGLPGIRMKTLCFGDRTLMAEFRLAAGSVLPTHAHPHEQTGYLVRGRMVLTIEDERHEAHMADSWCIPADVVHGAEISDDSVIIEVFAPVRDDYLPGGGAGG